MLQFNRQTIHAKPGADTAYLDPLFLDEQNLLKVVPSALLRDIPHNHLINWANRFGIYQFISTELIEFLQGEIGPYRAIEICAGDGCISRTLGIVGTDGYYGQTDPTLKAIAKATGNPNAKPPKVIKKHEALDAVRTFRSHVVVGAFVVQRCKDHHRKLGIEGSPFGVHEEEMLTYIKKYICFGNPNTHAGKFIFDRPHREYNFGWLFNRAMNPDLNRVWIWEN